MKICMLLFHDLINPRIDPRVYKEATSLIDFGCDVNVISWAVDFSGDGKSIERLPKYDEFENIKITRISQKLSSSNKPIFFRAFKQLSAMIKIAKEAILEKPQVVHSHDLSTLLSGVIVKKKLHIPLIYDSHEYWPGMVKERNGPILGIICSLFEKILLTQVDCVITVSGMLADYFSKTVPNTYTVYNSRKVNDTLSINEQKVKLIKSSLNISKKDFVVGYIGNINAKRGIDYLISSLSYIDDEHIKLLIVGGGNENTVKSLKQNINPKDKERVIFTGQVPYHEVLSYFSLLDIGCVLFKPLPNHSIAAPNKLFEYMSMGIPLIVSDLPEMCKIVSDDSKCGICVDPTDPIKIASSIKYLYSNPQKVKKMRQNGFEFFNDKYCWDKMENILKHIYSLRG